MIDTKACITIQNPDEQSETTPYQIEDIYVEEDSSCCCNSCGFVGTIKDFLRKKNEETK
jgi:hypothetical protein